MIHNLACEKCEHGWRQGSFTRHMPHVSCPKCGANKIKNSQGKRYDPVELDRKESDRRAQIMKDFPLKTTLKLKEASRGVGR